MLSLSSLAQRDVFLLGGGVNFGWLIGGFINISDFEKIKSGFNETVSDFGDLVKTCIPTC